MRVQRTKLKATLKLLDKIFLNKVATFPQYGPNYTLADVTLYSGSTVLQVPIEDGCLVRFYDDMKVFSESDIMVIDLSCVE